MFTSKKFVLFLKCVKTLLNYFPTDNEYSSILLWLTPDHFIRQGKASSRDSVMEAAYSFLFFTRDHVFFLSIAETFPRIAKMWGTNPTIEFWSSRNFSLQIVLIFM